MLCLLRSFLSMRSRTLCGIKDFTGSSCLWLILVVQSSMMVNMDHVRNHKPTCRNCLPSYDAIFLEVNFRDVDIRWNVVKSPSTSDSFCCSKSVFLRFRSKPCTTTSPLEMWPSCTAETFTSTFPLPHSGYPGNVSVNNDEVLTVSHNL